MKVKTHDLESLSAHEHGHIPYLLLLLYYLQIWKTSHGGKPPTGFPEKKAFRAIVDTAMRRDNAEGGEENFEEAVKAVNKSLNPPEISSGLRDVFESEDCKKPNPKVVYCSSGQDPAADISLIDGKFLDDFTCHTRLSLETRGSSTAWYSSRHEGPIR